MLTQSETGAVGDCADVPGELLEDAALDDLGGINNVGSLLAQHKAKTKAFIP